MSVFGISYDPGNYMEAAFAPVEHAHKVAAMKDTWGHLAPERDVKYHGFMIFARGAYGDRIPIESKFKGLPDSPWFFDDMMDFIEKRAIKEGAIYRFDGTYFNHTFMGITRRLKFARAGGG